MMNWVCGKPQNGKEKTMKKVSSLLLILCVTAIVVAYGTMVLAADAPAKPAEPAKPAAAAKAATEVKADVTGKLDAKMGKDRKTGKEVKHYSLTVSEAKAADGKALDALKGKLLHVMGRDKAAELDKLVGKSVVISGVIINDTRLKVNSMKEAAAPAAPAPAAPAK